MSSTNQWSSNLALARSRCLTELLIHRLQCLCDALLKPDQLMQHCARLFSFYFFITRLRHECC